MIKKKELRQKISRMTSKAERLKNDLSDLMRQLDKEED
jgi:hypothetical protein